MAEKFHIEIDRDENGHLEVGLPIRTSTGRRIGYPPETDVAIERTKAASLAEDLETIDMLYGRGEIEDCEDAEEVKYEALRQVALEFSFPDHGE